MSKSESVQSQFVTGSPESMEIEPDHIRSTAEVELWRRALLIRRFEQRLLEMYRRGDVRGTIHTCIGQEFTGIAVAEALLPGEAIFSNHRGHGHFLARTGEVRGLMAEILGRATGICRGWGGSQHLHVPGFYSNGILGGMSPVATGFALGEKLAGTGRLTTSFIGDGTFGEGVLYESFNIVSRWQIPILFVVENNRIAQSTAQEQTLAGSIAGRARAFGIPYRHGNTREWRELCALMREAAAEARAGSQPCLFEVETFRLEAHSRGDDLRNPLDIQRAARLDPLNRLAAGEPRLFQELSESIESELEEAMRQSLSDPMPAFVPEPSCAAKTAPVAWKPVTPDEGRVVDLLRQSLRQALTEDPKVLILGQDVEGPYGGAFKVTGSLSQEFPGRVLNTPISEAAEIGVGSGLGMNGFRPIVEIMFGDFLALGLDQLLNHASKFRLMYGDRVRVPVIVRAPMGGRRAYGPTHSQSLEKHFLGIPGLTVIALNGRVPPSLLYEQIFRCCEDPVLVIENKVLYGRFFRHEAPLGFRVELTGDAFPWVRLSPMARQAQVTVFCYGGMLEEAEDALSRAFDEEEILVEVLCPTALQPLDVRPLLESVTRTGRLLTVEEGTSQEGLGAEAAARLFELGVRPRAFKRLGWNAIVPTSGELESRSLPGAAAILDAVRELCSDS